MNDTPKTHNRQRKAISVCPEVYEQYMTRLAAHRKAAGYMVSNNELVTWLLNQEARTEISVKFEPVELRADGATLRSVMNRGNDDTLFQSR